MLRVRLLGGLSVLHDDGLPVGSVQPRRLAVLARIARAGSRGIMRELLLAQIWPDADDETGRKTLSQALYTLRRDLREPSLFEGVQELRLNPQVAQCDVVAFEEACARGDLEQAAGLYGGPFLEGFRVSSAPEFDRWVEEERSALGHRSMAVLEQLARQTAEAGELVRAVDWWRQAAARDPLNSRITVELMRALVAAGDRAGALQQAQIYEALTEYELELPPDEEVLTLAAQIRHDPAARRSPAADRGRPGAAEVPAAEPSASGAETRNDPLHGTTEPGTEATGATPAPPHRAAAALRTAAGSGRRRWGILVAALLLAAVAAPATVRWSAGLLRPVAQGTAPVLAVGHIADYTGDDVAPALVDMLATSLAQTDGLRVISTPRLYSLAEGGYQAEHLANAARKAGAELLVEASVYRTGSGGLRLDLRRIDLVSGALVGSQSVEASELFSLADEASLSLVKSLGLQALAGSSRPTTRSAAAQTLYEQGLRIFLNSNERDARPLFDAALAEDSTFAMAAFYAALTETWRPTYEQRMRTALRLAESASERERLFIRVNWAYDASSPALHALADSLVTRYPMEVEGHLYLGRALFLRGDYTAAVPHFMRAITMDSAATRRGSVPCHGCSAMRWLIATHMAVDSFDVAIRWAREWVDRQPHSAEAWWRLAEALEFAGHGAESVEAANQAMNIDPNRPYSWRFETGRGIRTGYFEDVDQLLRSKLTTGNVQHRSGARWMLAISLRHQGRLVESLAEARTNRFNATNSVIGNAVNWIATAEALAMLHGGDWRGAAALFDSIARFPASEEPSALAQHRAWFGAHVSTALAVGGDVASLPARADSVEQWGRQSAQGRDLMLHHYVRGLSLAHAGADEAAAESFRRAIVSPTLGFTKASLELARTLMRLDRPREAVPVLQAALRGNLESSNLYVTHTELHEALAQAWDAAGRADSAAISYAYVARAWAHADPVLQPRRAAAERRLREIEAGAAAPPRRQAPR